MIRLLSSWFHWHSAFLAWQAWMTPHHTRQKNCGSHSVTHTHYIAHVSCCTWAYLFPKQQIYTVIKKYTCIIPLKKKSKPPQKLFQNQKYSTPPPQPPPPPPTTHTPPKISENLVFLIFSAGIKKGEWYWMVHWMLF